ncbi:GIY-YIG nuclease family protein [Caulobacter sp. RHG1]|uniref:GIY-YIG nuclease family protein n=1 Tax=Caulobacter sp. (strain RHG1) TaxID=2545762 RepID=UPI001552EF7E|nr:GIY-YIG nuclease family protein [Caulobacter sp. RHG1]
MHDLQSAWVYMLRCRDGSYYVGSHRGPDVAARVSMHQQGFGGEYTSARLPVELVWCEAFQFITDAIAAERRIKGWSRAKKEAMIRGEWDKLPALSRRRAGKPLLQNEPEVRAQT